MYNNGDKNQADEVEKEKRRSRTKGGHLRLHCIDYHFPVIVQSCQQKHVRLRGCGTVQHGTDGVREGSWIVSVLIAIAFHAQHRDAKSSTLHDCALYKNMQ